MKDQIDGIGSRDRLSEPFDETDRIDETNTVGETYKNFQKEILGSVAVDSVKVRCPKCYQPYKVYATDIKESRPKFECRKCDCKFWLPFPEALNRSEQIGFPVSWLNVKSEDSQEEKMNVMHSAEDPLFQRTCSNCGKRHALNLQECPHCGVVAVKADALKMDAAEGVKSTPRLRDLWARIIENFESDEGHDQFLKEAEAQRCMDYASKRYADLEEAMGPDPMIEKMKSRIHALQEKGPITEPKAKIPDQKPVKTGRFWVAFSNFVLVLASVVCIIGMTLPGGKNMVGVGAAIAFFSLSLRLLQRS